MISSHPPCSGRTPKWLVAVLEVQSDRETIPTPVGMKDPSPHPRPVISSRREAGAQGASIPENLAVSSRTTENPAIKPQCWDGTMVLLNLVASPTLGWLGPPFPFIQTCPCEPNPEPARPLQGTERPLWLLPLANQQDQHWPVLYHTSTERILHREPWLL